ncbi:MAG: hypothetical protein E7208_01600 [Clostridium butyricum]|nr:hypothetical protein [Clostridium butyricum]
MRIGKVEIGTIDIVTFVGMVITLFTSILNLFQNKKSMYISNITKYRVTWISELKNYISTLKEISNLTNLHIISENVTDKMEFRRQLEKNVSLIKMHLNFLKALDRQLIAKMEKIKSIINSYLFVSYYREELKDITYDKELLERFYKVIETINEKKLLKEIISMVKVNIVINLDMLTTLELKNKIKELYREDYFAIKKIIIESDHILQKYENELEVLNEQIDKLVQIYLKIEWIRCKRETRMWPFNKYDEEKEIKKLIKKYEEVQDF